MADETINRVCLKLGDEPVENKTAYVYGFAKNVWLESLRRQKTHLNVDEVRVAAPPPAAEDFSGVCLDRCLAALPEDNRGLILDYFSEEKQAKIDLHKELAARLATTRTALRMRIVRIKQSLKSCVEECLAK
ncbi:MAG: hypothetical protein JSS81_10690 [Acidobacteria bacterium]|nr:hypothetical protein [Acidobacteriota bacterium]